MHIRDSLTLLNIYLRKKDARRSFIICGGASLILQGIIARTTKDIDIVAPPIDEELQTAAISVAEDLGLDSHWLNSGPESITIHLREGWKERINEVFKDTHLIVYSISREDLIFSKFWALCDRQKDKEDLILLRPSKEELESAAQFTKHKDANPDWPRWVDIQVKLIKKELGYD